MSLPRTLDPASCRSYPDSRAHSRCWQRVAAVVRNLELMNRETCPRPAFAQSGCMNPAEDVHLADGMCCGKTGPSLFHSGRMVVSPSHEDVSCINNIINRHPRGAGLHTRGNMAAGMCAVSLTKLPRDTVAVISSLLFHLNAQLSVDTDVARHTFPTESTTKNRASASPRAAADGLVLVLHKIR